MRHFYRIISLLAVAGVFGGVAHAHVGASGQLTAGSSGIVTFGVGHGCDGADTVRLRIEIPEAVTSVRGLTSAWGEGTFERDDTDRVVAVTFEKAEARERDDQYYQFSLRVGAPDAPFTTLYFPATQTCRDSEGTETEVEWRAMVSHDDHTTDENPAASVMVFPPRTPGWNHYVAPDHLHDLSIFADARIVWVGTAAYSANAETAALIESDPDVTTLAEIHPDSEIWVLY
ncbi:MAG: DUF1775 domain-containing protein [Polyangiales bacterium]|nr:DUF1775 domain-containing protein [Myxococcales bacterium]MCB9657111.1 DUF1775 domain-containing protein [Sandaracinaceae bacterium]